MGESYVEVNLKVLHIFLRKSLHTGNQKCDFFKDNLPCLAYLVRKRPDFNVRSISGFTTCSDSLQRTRYVCLLFVTAATFPVSRPEAHPPASHFYPKIKTTFNNRHPFLGAGAFSAGRSALLTSASHSDWGSQTAAPHPHHPPSQGTVARDVLF
jgi:hypothetical protein